MNFSKRSYQKELLDENEIPFEDIKRNMQELDTINTYLGGHQITISGLEYLLQNHSLKRINGNNGASIQICEIGCGGGNNLFALERWCRKNNINAAFIGIDIKDECIQLAAAQAPDEKFQWIVSDYKKINFEIRRPDIIFSSLFCHHFREAELINMIQWMQSNSTTGFFINDLHRHYLAYYSIKGLTALFSRSYLVKNDAPISVLRGFRKKEWEKIFEEAGIDEYRIQWKWAFRWLIVVSR